MVIQEEPPEVDFEFLKMIKVNNFKGHNNEMRLVKFLLEKTSALEYFVVVAPKELTDDEYNKNVVDGSLDFLHYLHLQLTRITKASPRANIILIEHDDCKFRPTRWEVYSTN